MQAPEDIKRLINASIAEFSMNICAPSFTYTQRVITHKLSHENDNCCQMEYEAESIPFIVSSDMNSRPI